MINIHLDTALLAIPNYEFGLSPDKVSNLIDRVNYFYRLIIEESVPVTLLLASDAEQTLGVDYPYPESIKDFLKSEGLDHTYSYNDLYTQYLTIMDRAMRPQEYEIFEPKQIHGFSSQPALREGLGPASLLRETERVFATVAAQTRTPDFWRLGSSMTGTASCSFSVNAKVTAATENGHQLLDNLPVEIDGSVCTLEHLNELIHPNAAFELWSKAETPDDLYLAVLSGSFHLRRAKIPNATIDGLRSFSIGSAFQESLLAHECGGTQRFSSVAFDVCCRVVANIDAISVGTMGRPKQTLRSWDKAAGHRTQITTGNPSLRLMHWEKNGAIEFSNVGTKKALFIAEGTRSTTSAEAVHDFLDFD